MFISTTVKKISRKREMMIKGEEIFLKWIIGWKVSMKEFRELEFKRKEIIYIFVKNVHKLSYDEEGAKKPLSHS